MWGSPFLEVPRTRAVVFWGLISGNHHIGTAVLALQSLKGTC